MKKLLILIGFILIILACSGFSEIDGNTVYVNNSDAFILAEPHTIYSSGWVYFNLTMKEYSGNMDVIFGFGKENVKPAKIEVYDPHTVYWNETYQQEFNNVSSLKDTIKACEIGDGKSKNKKEIVYTMSYTDESNKKILSQKSNVVCFDSYVNKSNNFSINFHTEKSQYFEFEDKTSSVSKSKYSYSGIGNWFSTDSISVTKNKSHTIRAYIDVPVGFKKNSGKYWFAVKPSSETIAQAVANAHLYSLDPWWSASWTYCKNITITNPSYETLTDFPVYINVTYVSGKMNADWSDIRFVNDSCNGAASATTLNHEFVTNVSSAGEFHVKIPSLPTTGVNISMYYGNAGATSASTNTTWSNGYMFVEHFDDYNSTVLNESAYGYIGNKTASGSPVQINATMGTGQRFDGVNDWVNYGNIFELGTSNVTFEYFVNFTADIQRVFNKYVDVNNRWYFGTYTSPSNTPIAYSLNPGVTHSLQTASPSLLRYNLWSHAAFAVDKTNLLGYCNINGTNVTSWSIRTVNAAGSTLAANISVGKYDVTYFNLEVDEIRISKAVRTPGWLNATFRYAFYQNSFVVFGAEELAPGGDPIYYSVANGNWTDPATWHFGVGYPDVGDTAWVNHYVNITWGMQANATNIFINSTGTLNVSGWANITFNDAVGCGFTFINGTLDLNGSVDYPILINVLGIVPATDWGGAVSNLHVWFARFARFDNYAGLWENGGKLVWNNINFTNQASYLYTRALDAGTSITNTVLTNKWYFYQNAASYYFDNITVKSPGVLLLSNNVLGVTFNNLKIETNTFDAISFYQNTVNITLINLTNAGGLYARSTVDNVNLECYNCDTDVNSVFDAEAVYYRRMNFNNSNFTTTNWYLVTTPGSYIASRNHNSVANSWHGWFNQTNHTQIFGAMSLSDWGMTESDNVWMHGGILHIDENTNANNITIPAGSRINITVDDRLWVRENISNADLLLVNYGNLTAGNVTTESTGKFFAESSNITMNGIFNLSGTGYLSNTTLDMNLTSDGQFNITANSGSRLEIENYTKINSTSTGFEYLIDIKYGASFEMNNSRVEECGWDAADVGLTVSANNANITYNNITRGYMGLSILGNYSSILNNYVYNNSGYGIYLSGSLYNNFSNNNIFNNTLDNMRFSSSSNYNTILSNNISLSWGYGIRLAGSSSNNISYNNISSNHWDGVYGIIARYNNISHNTIFNNTLDGIDLRATSNYNNVTYNNVSGNGISGIYINSNYFLIASNNFSNNSYDGIEIYDSSYINVTDNIVYNNTYTGIRLNLSSWNNISNNTVTFNERGIRLENYCRNNNISNNNVSSNTIRGIHLYYGCDNSTIFNNNLQITNLGPINSSFIQIEDSYNINVTYNTLADNLCDDTSRCYGIALLYVNNTVISWNNIRNITSISIRLGEVVNGTVHNNTVYNTSWGQIYLGDSENVTVANNYLRNTDGHGMHLQSSNLLTIRDNIIGNLSGLRAPFRSGIMLHDTGNSTITNNTMSNITSVGILLNVTGTINNTAQNNTIFNSTYGIGVFSGAENNSFLYNTIYNCSYGLNVSNANISNHYFANSTISNSTFYEVALDTNSQVTLLNVTFNKSNTSIVNNSVLTLRWYVDIIAVHADYTPFENVLVRIRNVSGHQLNWELTNATGYIARKTLVEYEQTPTYKNDWNNHDFSGEFQALFGSNTSNITTNDVGSVYIVLAGGPPGGGGGAWKPKPGINISLCGNGKIDENETCENCAEDFEKLYGKGFCALPVAEAGGWPWWIILIFVGAYLIYKREELSERRRMYERKKLLGRAFISRRKKPVKSHVIYRKYRGY